MLAEMVVASWRGGAGGGRSARGPPRLRAGHGPVTGRWRVERGRQGQSQRSTGHERHPERLRNSLSPVRAGVEPGGSRESAGRTPPACRPDSTPAPAPCPGRRPQRLSSALVDVPCPGRAGRAAGPRAAALGPSRPAVDHAHRRRPRGSPRRRRLCSCPCGCAHCRCLGPSRLPEWTAPGGSIGGLVSSRPGCVRAPCRDRNAGVPCRGARRRRFASGTIPGPAPGLPAGPRPPGSSGRCIRRPGHGSGTARLGRRAGTGGPMQALGEEVAGEHPLDGFLGSGVEGGVHGVGIGRVIPQSCGYRQ